MGSSAIAHVDIAFRLDVIGNDGFYRSNAARQLPRVRKGSHRCFGAFDCTLWSCYLPTANRRLSCPFCGSGTMWLPSHHEQEIIASDISPDAVTVAEELPSQVEVHSCTAAVWGLRMVRSKIVTNPLWEYRGEVDQIRAVLQLIGEEESPLS